MPSSVLLYYFFLCHFFAFCCCFATCCIHTSNNKNNNNNIHIQAHVLQKYLLYYFLYFQFFLLFFQYIFLNTISLRYVYNSSLSLPANQPIFCLLWWPFYLFVQFSLTEFSYFEFFSFSWPTKKHTQFQPNIATVKTISFFIIIKLKLTVRFFVCSLHINYRIKFGILFLFLFLICVERQILFYHFFFYFINFFHLLCFQFVFCCLFTKFSSFFILFVDCLS